MEWKVYYGDGSTFSSRDGTPQRAPGLDVQMIVVSSHDHGWRSVTGDYYVWDYRGGKTRWWGVDLFGLWEYLFTQSGYKCVLAGKMTSNKQFDKISRDAMKDPDFQKKTTFANKERKA